MAEERTSFPSIIIQHWWALREKFKQSVPSEVTESYLEAALNTGASSAKKVIPPLRKMNILDEKNKPTNRAREWRLDDHYAEVCAAIRDELYPEELLHAVPGPEIDFVAAEKWFSRKTGLGKQVVKRMAALYQLLWEADPTKKEATRPVPRLDPVKRGATLAAKQAAVTQRPRKKTEVQQDSQESLTIEPSSVPQQTTKSPPALHINIQVHISPESTIEQLDQIFASMAKHFKELM